MKITKRGTDSFLQSSLQILELAQQLGVEVEVRELSKCDQDSSVIWFQVRSLHGTEARIGYFKERKDGHLPSMSCVREFLTLFQRKERETIVIEDYGRWIPPANSPICQVRFRTHSGKNITRFYVTFLDIPENAKEIAVAKKFDNIRHMFRADLEFMIELSDRLEADVFVVPNKVGCKLTGSSKGSSHHFNIKKLEGRYFMELHKEDENSVQSEVVPARITIGDVSMSFSDFLSLQAGDEIELDCTDEIPALLTVSGITVSEGALSIEEGALLFKVKQLDSQDEFGGNILSLNTISEEEGFSSRSETTL